MQLWDRICQMHLQLLVKNCPEATLCILASSIEQLWIGNRHILKSTQQRILHLLQLLWAGLQKDSPTGNQGTRPSHHHAEQRAVFEAIPRLPKCTAPEWRLIRATLLVLTLLSFHYKPNTGQGRLESTFAWKVSTSGVSQLNFLLIRYNHKISWLSLWHLVRQVQEFQWHACGTLGQDSIQGIVPPTADHSTSLSRRHHGIQGSQIWPPSKSSVAGKPTPAGVLIQPLHIITL